MTSDPRIAELAEVIRRGDIDMYPKAEDAAVMLLALIDDQRPHTVVPDKEMVERARNALQLKVAEHAMKGVDDWDALARAALEAALNEGGA